MSVVSPLRPTNPEPNKVVSGDISDFDHYPGSDIVLRSGDSHNFQVPKLYIVICSPVLGELIRRVSITSEVPKSEEKEPLPVIKLPESKATLYNLLTFIFPVTPVLPSTAEKIMELLSVAQKYRIDSVLTRIRGAISRQDPPFLRPETALHVYFLAQQHGLHQEALQAARVTLRLSMTIEGLGNKLEFPGMTGAYLHELWRYHQRVRTDLKPVVLEFRNSGLPDVVNSLRCISPRSGTLTFPQWVDDYINSIAESLHLFDLIEFENSRARHIKSETYSSQTCSCVDISSQIAHAFWEALTAVVHRTIEKADSTLDLVKEEPTSENSNCPFAVPLCLDIPDANIIVRSSDQANFRVHKSVLALSSSFFKHRLSLPQPPDGKLVDGLPVIQLSEDVDLLNSLVSLLYPISPVIPHSYEQVFALLAACQKYDMTSIQSYIRVEIKRGAFPAPVGAEGFHAYAVASSLRLIPEMESAARLTLGRPMTFESLGEGLRSFKGRALCDLVRYRVAATVAGNGRRVATAKATAVTPDVGKPSGGVLVRFPPEYSHQLAVQLLYEQER
ncbi:hypothetical protein BJY52DRAFT_1402385 [Lactarius psammicola]|nr:hypothetical protein BJY52DRAFT_1402385 [Lactarius psammicola]